MRPLALLALLAVTGIALAEERPRRWTLEVEGLSTGMTKNRVGIPGDNGTRFNFRELTGQGNFRSALVALTFTPERGGEWRLLVAPLEVRGTGRLRRSVRFEDATFAPGVPTRGTYRFNSYRLTWRNTWTRTERSHWRVGATLKVRDAEIALRQGALARSKTDVGLVPLLHVYGEQELGGPWSFVLDFDGAWAPQGRAIDLGLRLRHRVGPATMLTLGVRTLEGGADNPEVYNFSQFNSISLGVTTRF